MSNAQPSTLPDKIERRAATVAVTFDKLSAGIGLGYVGLPLAVAFAEAGFHAHECMTP
jgi:UDP-N-acetyl-D-mannosaminuronate dehydrogenase